MYGNLRKENSDELSNSSDPSGIDYIIEQLEQLIKGKEHACPQNNNKV